MKIKSIIFLCVAILGLASYGVTFAAEHRDVSFYLIRLINDMRKSPGQILEGGGIDMTIVRDNLGTNSRVLDHGLPPLAWDDRLYESALAHANDMINNLYYAYESQDGTTIHERIEGAGYKFIHAGESLGVLSFDRYIDPFRAAESLFVNMLAYELSDRVLSDYRNILSEHRTEVGIAFVSAMADLGFALPVNIYLVVADFATPVSSGFHILGNISAKTDDAPVFELQHARPGVHLKLRQLGTGRTVDTLSDVTGFYQFPSFPGFLMLEVWDNSETVLQYRQPVFGMGRNQRLDLFIDD